MINKITNNFRIYGFKGFLENSSWEIRMRYRWIFKKSFSQGHEDLIIEKLLGHKKTGFYVDVGAFDPTRFSNTKRFYLKGWKGINIEPDPIRFKKFQLQRPNDINLNMGIANKTGSLDFFYFDPQTLSTFSKSTAKDYQKQGHQLISSSKIKVITLKEVFEKYVKTKPIDFISIDTEGFDLEVLKSNNWKKYKPKIICIEGHDKQIENFVTKLDYQKVNQTVVNSIYCKSD